MEVNQEIRASNKACKRNVLDEIERNRVESFDTKDDCDFYGNGKTGRRVALTDSGVYNHRVRPPLHASQSLNNQSEDNDDGDEHKINEDHVKFQTLPCRPNRPKKAGVNRRPKANEPLPGNLNGQLYKTSRGKITTNVTRGQHEHRQLRSFQLTEHSLEYSQRLQRVNVRRQFPLTSIYDIVYNAEENCRAFKLQFCKSEILLEANDESDCKLWVKSIKREWNKWPKPVRKASVADRTRSLVGITESSGEEQGETPSVRTSINIAGGDTPSTDPTSPSNETHAHKYLRQESDVSERNYRRDGSLTKVAIQKKLGLLPRIQRSKADYEEVEKRLAGQDYLGALHDIDFVMTKYPRKNKSSSLPHERVFTMDCDNLLIMWRHTEYSKFNQLKTILAEHIVEIKEGQNSDGFDRYPYEELEDHSLSILIEGELQAGPAINSTYAVLQSLDLVCESHEEQKLWCEALRSLIHPKKHLSMYSNRFELTDPTILWLKSHWILISEGKSEIKENEALVFGQSVVPQMSASDFKSKLDVALQYNLRVESLHHVNYLYWDSFILFYNLLCEINDSNCSLLQLYQDYAKDHSGLGMTKKEFEKFLTEQQHWRAADAEDQSEQLIQRYDYYHESFKLYLANKKPEQFQTLLQCFSFAGFLSFLRSVDNCVIDREHEAVYQDMTQPLSHYFINSSHNTYLEGHQLTGLSTTDAYVRALLQGCRCLELDCWDGANGQPKITHGNTLVSELSFEEVVETINKYAFRVSKYPLILSLENHCSEPQQVVMAQTFQKIFGDKLVKQNTVEQDGTLLKLPSPEELKEKIILKGRRKLPDERRTSDERGGGIAQRFFQRTIRLIHGPSGENDRPDLQASQENLEVANKENSLESSHPDEKDNVTIASDNSDNKTESFEECKPEYEEEQKKLHEDLSKLIVYCQAKKINPWSWQLQRKTPVHNMFSFDENTALNKCKRNPKDMLACAERQFVRTYPAGKRTDSSNYDPIPLWNHGIQMVALNVQTPALPMYLNQGKFRQNGGCGYILKPKIMRDPNETVYNPNTMTRRHHSVTPVNLEITLLSGQNFIIPNKKTSSMEILYQTYGIPNDYEPLSHTVLSDDTTPLWPQFNDAPMLKKTILMPELCLVLFAVNINVQRKLKAGTKQVLLGQNVFSLTSLKSGIHFVPLRKPGGDPISHIGIFVKIKCSQEQASYDVQPTSVSLENEISASQTHNGTDIESSSIDNGGHPKAYRLLRQQAIAADISSDC